MRKYTLILWLLVCTAALVASTNTIKFNHLPINESFFHPTITSLYQDENGTIWITTTEGFLRYDGIKTEDVFPLDFTARVGHIYSNNIICGNKAGLIYFNQRDNVLEYDIRKESYHAIFSTKLLKNKSVSNIFYYDNTVYAILDNQIIQYKEGKESVYYSFPSSVLLSYLFKTTDGNMFVGTFESGVYKIDKKANLRKVIDITSRISSIFEDSKKNLWFSTRNLGVIKLESSGKISHLMSDSKNAKTLINNHISCVIEDNKGVMWIATMLGLDRLDPNTGDISHYGNSKDNDQRLRNLYVRCFMKDKQGTIWLGTYYGGVSYFNTDVKLFTNIDVDSNNSTWTSIINLTVDKQNNIWACTSDKGLYFYDRKNGVSRFYNIENSGISTNYLKSIYYDAQKDGLWIGTFMKGLCFFDLKSKKFTIYSVSKNGKTVFPEVSDIIIKIIPFKNDILFSTFTGVFKLNSQTKEITFIHPNDYYISSIRVDNQDNLWISDFSNKLQVLNLKTNKEKVYKFNSTISIYDIFEDQEKNIWIATYGNGIAKLDKSSDNFIFYNYANCGLQGDFVSCLSQTSNGLMIAGTNSGISVIDIKNKKSINFNSQNGFPIVSMKYGCIYRNKDELIIGGINGLTSLKEEDIIVKDRPFNMYFSELKVNNKKVKANDDTRILKEALPYTKSISLNYKQTLLEIGFSTDNYIESDPNLFQYKLDGYDTDWKDFSSKSSISYMNLPSGKYKLKVRSKNPDSNNSNKEIRLDIRINPPFYASWYAYLFYLLSVLAILYGIFLYYHSKLTYKNSLDYERKDKEMKELTHQWKLRFFTNISHEFRTPLTLIIGQLDMLMQSAKITPHIYNYIISIQHNANKMMNLIGELMDFRKQDQGFMKITVCEQNLVPFVEEVYNSFLEFSRFKDIQLSFKTNEKDIPVWFDAVQLQKCFYNLISNAFKYSSKGGKIVIQLEKLDDLVKISVIDSGQGIAPEFLDLIFDRFYQVEDGKDTTSPGTGIGLALAKGIVELHGGKISVESTVNVGSVFSVDLIFDNQHFIAKENVEISTKTESSIEQLDFVDEHFIQEVKSSQLKYYANMPKLLIVEDDTELRLMLLDIFQPIYQVYEAANGVEGLAKTKEIQPDIIISDLMMPLMSGIEMCMKIKTDFEICHIPVIMLTAQTAVEQNIEGLNSGADDYICKPFNLKILITRCNNLLYNRKIIQEKFTKEPIASIQLTTNNPIDNQFINKAIQLVENNVANEKLDVQMLCAELGVSRTALFTKMKALVGQTPNEFIQTIRLKKAAWMLIHYPTKKISDIAVEIGFGSVQYFGTCFKNHFGVLASEYRKKKED